MVEPIFASSDNSMVCGYHLLMDVYRNISTFFWYWTSWTEYGDSRSTIDYRRPYNEHGCKDCSRVVQTASALLYIIYISIAIPCIGVVSRQSVFSFCCLAAGIVVFGVVPAVTGACILVTILFSGDSVPSSSNVETDIRGITTAVLCFLSTITCCCVLCMAILCGSKGRGKNSRYPTPLAYIPFLRDFVEVREESGRRNNAGLYTSDYPPPCSDFPDRRHIAVDRHRIHSI